eukprot:gene12205-15333_t
MLLSHSGVHVGHANARATACPSSALPLPLGHRPRSSNAPVSIPRLATYSLRQSPAGISPAGASTSFARPVSGRGPVHARAVPSLREYSPPVEDLAGMSRVLLWFKHDLRVDDHPGLTACASAGVTNLTCLYVIDHDMLAPLLYTPGGPELLLASLQSLQRDLQARGCELLLQTGSVDEVVPAVARSVGAEAIVMEREVIHGWGEAADRATQELVQQDGVKAVIWSSTVWNPRAFDINFKGWKAKRGDAIGPLKTPNALPAAPSSLPTSDSLPSPEELRFMLDYAGSGSLSDDDMHEVAEKVHAWTDNKVESKVVKLVAAAISAGDVTPTQALQAYLNNSPTPSQSPAQQQLAAELATAVSQLEIVSSRGASFPALFGPMVSLGTLSRPMKATESSDFHRQLATLGSEAQRATQPEDLPAYSVRQWMWRGHSMEYVICEPQERRPDAPTIMLVHGFGAFGEQWRDNTAQLASQGFRVFAPTLAGFGRSEKGAIGYSQDSWRDYLRDFTLQIVKEPVVLAGNSIGGFIGSSMLADYPSLGRGLVLLNSAGPVNASFDMDDYNKAVLAKKPPPEFVVQLVSRGLFVSLALGVERTLKWLYPTAPHRADEWLAAEISRAAADPGSLEVFQSAFYLPPPRALNYLVQKFWSGPTLVLQGILDPLNDARGRAGDMKTILSSGVTVVLLEAGHCPMDEQPTMVNENLIKDIPVRIRQIGDN